ncbi:hypothetical protein FRC06_003588, partial [Ceratobasidium sp. 370]
MAPSHEVLLSPTLNPSLRLMLSLRHKPTPDFVLALMAMRTHTHSTRITNRAQLQPAQPYELDSPRKRGLGATQLLSLCPPLLQRPKATQTPEATETLTVGLKEKEVVKSIGRRSGASLDRRAGELIASFECGATGTSRPMSPTKSDASFVSAASGGGAAAVTRAEEWQYVKFDAQMVSPGNLSTSLSTFTTNFTNTGTGRSDSGSTISSPFARSCGTGVRLVFGALFSPCFPAARAGSPFRPASPARSAASGAGGSYVSGTYKDDGASETYRSGGSRSETARSETARLKTSGTSDTYRTATSAKEAVTVRSGGSVRPRFVASDTYRSVTATYTGAGSETYLEGSGSETYRTGGSSSGRSRSVATDTYHSDTCTTGTGGDTFGPYTQGLRTESPPPTSVPPKSPTTPPASRVRRAESPGMPTTPKTPNQHHKDKFADRQERTHHADTPYSVNISLTPKAIGSMTPGTQTGAMTLRTLGGRFGRALSEASTAPTSAEGLMRQRMSRDIVNSVPVPSESEAIGLGHNAQD